jgi:hypothetical protein
MCGVIEAVIGGGAVLNAIASVKGGIDQKKAANQAASDTMDAAREQSADVRQRAAIVAGQIAMQGADVAAQQRAIMGSSLATGGTTGGKVIESAIANGRDQDMVKSNAARQAFGLERNAYRQAQAYKTQGKAAFVNGILGAGGGLLSGAGQVASYAGRYQGPKE